MTAFSERQRAILSYCRIDDPAQEELALLEGMYGAAVSYMANAGVSEPASGSERLAQYNLCINYLVLCMYDQRSIVITGTIVSDNPVFRQILNQLKLTEPPRSDSDTEG